MTNKFTGKAWLISSFSCFNKGQNYQALPFIRFCGSNILYYLSDWAQMLLTDSRRWSDFGIFSMLFQNKPFWYTVKLFPTSNNVHIPDFRRKVSNNSNNVRILLEVLRYLNVELFQCCFYNTKGTLSFSLNIFKALVRSKNLAALALNFFETLRSRSKRFERRSILRSF